MFYFQRCNERLGPQQMNYNFSVSLKNKYIFCEVAKSGCSAVKKELWRQELMGVPLPEQFVKAHRNPHAPFEQHLLIKPFQLGQTGFNDLVRDPSVVKWAVVRNPYSRALSGYLDKVCRNEPQFRNLAPNIAKLRGTEAAEVDHATVTFEEYCTALSLFEDPRFFDPHWRPQYYHICGDIIPYSHIVKLETLNEERQNLSKILGLREMTFKEGSSHATGSNSKIHEYFNKNCRRIIHEVYKQDFEKFNYPTEL
nr:sulfotransferase family 2 domain-containing protein [uncultured Cohaesibacter sp.]